MKLFIIDPISPGDYYISFNLLSYAIGWMLLYFIGRKMKLPMLPWMMMIASTFTGFVIGNKLMAMSAHDWNFLWENLHLSRDPGRTLLGGLIFGAFSLLLARWYFKMPWKSIDAFAYVFPVGLAMHRIGCFLAGCCFGSATEVPWGVHYGQHTTAYSVTINHAIENSLFHSHALHPVQLYEIGLSVLILTALYLLRKKTYKAGNILLLSIGLYTVGRFILEFYRYTEIHQVQWMSVKQIALLFITMVIFLIIIIREKKISMRDNMAHIKVSRNPLPLLGVNILLMLVASYMLLPFEIISMLMCLIPCIAVLGTNLIQKHTVPGLKWANISLVFLSLILMSQGTPEQDEEEKESATLRKINSIYGGFMAGKADLRYENLDCSGSPIQGGRIDYENRYNIGAAGFEQTRIFSDAKKGVDKKTFGVQAFAGQQLDRAQGVHNVERILNVYGITPFYRMDTRKWGAGLGGTFGNFAKVTPYADGRPTSLTRYWFYPLFNARFGAQDVFYVELRSGDYFPSAFPGFNTQLAGGFMDKNHRNGLRFGMASTAGFFINPKVYLSNTISVEPMIGFLPSTFINYEAQDNFHFSFRVNYIFENKDRKE